MIPKLSDEVKVALSPSKAGKTVYVMAGNMLRGDDGVGPFIAGKLRSNQKDFVIIDAGEWPEDFIGRIIQEKPSKTIFIDAADFQGEAGEVRVLSYHTLHDPFISTHRFPLRAITQIIEEDTGSKVSIIGIQIHSVNFGSKMERCVEESAEKIIEFLQLS